MPRPLAIRAHLRSLVQRPAERIPGIDGLRALAVLWVLAFHGVLFLAPHLEADGVQRLTTSAWGRFALQGELGVDAFFVISGFLITGLLLRELDTGGRVLLLRFYLRRALRLLPAAYVVMAFCAWLAPQGIHTIWTNLVYVNNFVPFHDSFMGWAWSLAIEEQFYAVFPLVLPWLIRRERPLRWIIGLVGAGVALRALLAWVGDVGPFPHHPPWLAGGAAGEDFVRHWDWLYTRPYTRGGALLIGVGLAFFARTSSPATWPARRLLLLGIALMVPVLLVSRAAPPGEAPVLPSALGHAYLAAFHTVFALGVGAVLASSLAGGLARRVLDAWIWYPIAQLSYCIYLVNPLSVGFWYSLLAATGQPLDPAGWQLGAWINTFVTAFFLYVLIERPFMALRR